MKYLLSDIAKIVGGELRGLDVEVWEVATDSRSTVATDGVLFAATPKYEH